MLIQELLALGFIDLRGTACSVTAGVDEADGHNLIFKDLTLVTLELNRTSLVVHLGEWVGGF